MITNLKLLQMNNRPPTLPFIWVRQQRQDYITQRCQQQKHYTGGNDIDRTSVMFMIASLGCKCYTPVILIFLFYIFFFGNSLGFIAFVFFLIIFNLLFFFFQLKHFYFFKFKIFVFFPVELIPFLPHINSPWQSITSRLVYYLERFISTVGQHVSLQPTLTGGRCVIHLATLPQTNKYLENGHKDRGGKQIRPVVMEFRWELTFILCRLLISPENGSR